MVRHDNIINIFSFCIVKDVIKVNKDLDEVLKQQKVVLKESRKEIDQLKDKVLKANTKLQTDSWNENLVRNQMDEVTTTFKLELKTVSFSKYISYCSLLKLHHYSMNITKSETWIRPTDLTQLLIMNSTTTSL